MNGDVADKPRHGLNTILVSVVALVALAELVWGLVLPGRAPSQGDWDAASARVRANFRSGDLVVFAPAWMDQKGRAALGELIPVEMAGRADDDRYGRIWEVALGGARYPAGDAQLREEQAFGRLVVRRYDKPSVRVVYDLTSHAHEARVVTLDERGQERPCLAEADGGFRCPAGLVEPRTLEVDYRPRRGLLVPSDASHTTRIELADVTNGKTLVGYLGLHDYYSRKNGEGWIDLKVFVDGTERTRLRYRQEEGWRRFEVDLSGPVRATNTRDLRFEVSAGAPATRRTVGLHAEVRQ